MTHQEANGEGGGPASSTWFDHALIWARRWGRILWVCRVSVVSVAAGAALFSLAQVRDLFLDFPGVGGFSFSVPWELLPATLTIDYVLPFFHALVFAVLVGFVWAMAVYSVARLAVADSGWLKSPYGLRLDAENLDEIHEAFAEAAITAPRLLGGLCIFIPLFSAAYTLRGLLWGGERGLIWRAYLNIGLTVLFLVVAIFCFWRYIGDRRSWRNVALTHWRHRRRSRNSLRNKDKALDGDHEDADAARIKFADSRNAWLTLMGPVVVLAAPGATEHFFSRLWLVPILLGAWVPLLGYIARLSHRRRAPLILLALALIAFFDLRFGDDHTVDLVQYVGAPGPGEADPNKQIVFSEAIKSWRYANDCQDSIDDCPSPIIVATTGGASRAAFFTATALGLLLDATCPDSNSTGDKSALTFQSVAGKGCSTAPMFAKRLFALSGVSGGAVGSAVFARSLVDGRSPDGSITPPCKLAQDRAKALGTASTYHPTLYFGATKPETWRACLQAILAQDFLTPVMAGLGFRDVFAFVGGFAPNWWLDRGHRLERAIANAYTEVALGTGDPSKGMDEDFLTVAPPVLTQDAASPSSAQSRDWRPIILLNSTSVESGRRVVFSTLAPTYASSKQPGLYVDWLTDAYDFHAVVDKDHGARDTSLAAAAHNSARFPLISPAGTLFPYRAKSSTTPTTGLGDPDERFGRLVDGGYFDNFGAMTARDLAEALAREGLRPFVILITNDPGSAPAAGATPLAWASANPANPDLSNPDLWRFAPALQAVLSTRTAHGDFGLELLRKLIDPTLAQGSSASPVSSLTSCFASASNTATLSEPCFTQLAVYAEPDESGVAGRVKDISMSWWASKLVQEYLDAQVAIRTTLSESQHKVSALEERYPTLKTAQCRNRRAYQTICGAMFPVKQAGTQERQISQAAKNCNASVDAQINALADADAMCARLIGN